MAREEGGSHLIGNEGRINLPDLAKQARIVASLSHTHPDYPRARSSLIPPDRQC